MKQWRGWGLILDLVFRGELGCDAAKYDLKGDRNMSSDYDIIKVHEGKVVDDEVIS